MVYVGNENLRNMYDRQGNLIKKLSDEEVINMINTSFSLRDVVTRVVLR